MRKRFEQQLGFGQIPIEEVEITTKCRDAGVELLAALQKLFSEKEYNEKIFNELENELLLGKKKTGRTGMDLWHIFVLAQLRLCKDLSYDRLHYLANHDKLLRSIMGIERESGFEQIEFEYQNIYDNVTLLSDTLVQRLNEIVLSFGHSTFKKKEAEALRLKTDSFVVESNVHFPTDYNLLWDSARKCLDIVDKLLKKHSQLVGWRKLSNWRKELKGLMRELGKASSSGGKNKEHRVKSIAGKYIVKARNLMHKLEYLKTELPLTDEKDLALAISLENFIILTNKHIELVSRRIINGEQIPHNEKMFSIFEDYTEWVKKGKLSPSVELGKKLAITTDHFNLIIDYRILEEEQDRDIVIKLGDKLLQKWAIKSWSFDKGFWNKDNRDLLQLSVPIVVMPKLGKRNQQEECLEKSANFKRLKNKHSTIESNINELEYRGLDRCPDRGYNNYMRYIGLGVCAFNLKKIGKVILNKKREEIKQKQLSKAA